MSELGKVHKHAQALSNMAGGNLDEPVVMAMVARQLGA